MLSRPRDESYAGRETGPRIHSIPRGLGLLAVTTVSPSIPESRTRRRSQGFDDGQAKQELFRVKSGLLLPEHYSAKRLGT